MQPAHGVLDALGTGHLAERQVRVGPVGQCPVYRRQGVAELTELVRGTVAITGPGHQPLVVHLGQPLADELLADEGEAGGDITHTHGAALLGQGLCRPGGPLRRYQGQCLLNAPGVDKADLGGCGLCGGGHGGNSVRTKGESNGRVRISEGRVRRGDAGAPCRGGGC